MGEEAKQGRPPWRRQQGPQRPRHPLCERGPPPASPSGPPPGPGRHVGGRSGRWAETSPGRPARAPGRLPWQQASPARRDLTIGGGRQPLPAPAGRTWPRARPPAGPQAHGHTHSLPRCPARLLACSAQRCTIHDWPPKPGWGSPGVASGTTPKPAPLEEGASGR